MVHVHRGNLSLRQTCELTGVEHSYNRVELSGVELTDLLRADGLQLRVAQRHELRGVNRSNLRSGEGLKLASGEGCELLGIDGGHLCGIQSVELSFSHGGDGLGCEDSKLGAGEGFDLGLGEQAKQAGRQGGDLVGCQGLQLRWRHGVKLGEIQRRDLVLLQRLELLGLQCRDLRRTQTAHLRLV